METADLTFRDYQEQARRTDQVPLGESKTDPGMIVPLLGLVGEAGSLLTEFKKRIRDGENYRPFEAQAAEELGDLLWYLANIADKLDLDLEEVARGNLGKVARRWEAVSGAGGMFDGDGRFDHHFPPHERLPRTLRVEFRDRVDADGVKRLTITREGEPVGDPLSDNSHAEDGYRYHDVFHFTTASMLNWSPVTRRLLRCKRKSDRQVDEVEDGARAAVIEEALSALVYDFAKRYALFEGATAVSYELLRTVETITEPYEVGVCGPAEWQRAILAAFTVWRPMIANGGGVLVAGGGGVRYEPLESDTSSSR